LKIWGQKPYYSGYNPPVYPEVLEFAGDRPKDDMATEDHVIEYITSPNNPDGEIRERVLEGRDAVWDSAYYWPTYTAMQGPQDLRGDDMSLWTLSKLTGHASSRVGWAWVKDAEVARKMQSIACPIGCPLQSQMFAAAALEHVIETKGHIFEWGRAQFEARWQQLRELFQSSSSFQIENPFPVDGRNHTPPYLWFKCTKGSALEGHTNTNGQPSLGVMLRDNGIAARPGEYFGTGQEDHARISLYVATSTFDLFIRKMRVIFAAVDAP
jgi:aspartate/methionine/tyrosine aminotransferase